MTKPTHPSIAKFADFVQLKDYRQPTKDEYVRYVRKLGSPREITTEAQI